VLYDRLTETQRVRLHRRIAEHKEAAYGMRAGEIAAELAVHFERGRDLTRAAQYLGKAVENAVCRSAHQEAIEQLTTGLAVVARLSENHRPQQELVLNLRLGVSLGAIRGYTSPEVQQAYARALEISQRLEQTPQLFPALWGLWLYYEQKGELLRAQEIADRLLAVAQQQDDPILLIQAHHAAGGTNFFRGEGDLARSHLEQGMACYNAHKQHLRTTTYVFEPGVGCLGMLATTLWMLGYADQALTRCREAVTIARAADHRSSLAHALRFAALIHHLRGEPQATQEYATAAVTVSTESGFSYWFALGTMLQGWALAAQGKHDEGQATFLQGLSILRTIGTRVGEPLYLSILAEMYRETGQTEQGLSTLAEAFTFAEASGIGVSTAELYRLKGELTLSRVSKSQILNPSSHAEAEACFLKALEVTQQQHAKSLELRTSLSLARLWQHQGKSTEARELLQGIYDWVSEGFDTSDLREAEALLVTLGGKVKTEDEKRKSGRMGERANGREENDSCAVPIVSSRPLLSLFSAPRPATSDVGPRTPDAVFRNEGDYWTVTFSGTTCRVRDTLGMHYLVQLLLHPHQEVHVLTLAAEEPGFTQEARLEDVSNDGMRRGFTDAGEILDPQARMAYRQRLRDLQEELTEAQSFNDPGRIEKLQEEVEFLTQELAQAVGLGGKSRKTTSVAERARVNVTKRIKIALRKISEQHPPLGEYLTQTIRTGTFCEYVPLPHQPVTWEE
jgi:tetratricopeptide (TPR) repeat protein